MAVKLRLARIGKKKHPVYRIVAIDSRNKRNGAALEVLGTYNPLRNEFVQFHADRIAFWHAQGAISSAAVTKLCKLKTHTVATISE